jgi:hypothetical protein
LPSPFPHSSAFPTFDQKKRLENEPERKLGTWEKQAKQKGARSQGAESQGEGAREKKEQEPGRRRAKQRAR